MPAKAPEIDALEVRCGTPLRLSAQRGRAVLVTFGLTSCDGACPKTLAKLHALLEALGPDAARVRAFFVSVDPERDTPERFKAFLDGYDPRIEGLYVEPAGLTQVLDAYKAIAIKRPRALRRPGEPAPRVAFAHSASLWLVDPRGDLRARYSVTATAEELAADVKRLLAER